MNEKYKPNLKVETKLSDDGSPNCLQPCGCGKCDVRLYRDVAVHFRGKHWRIECLAVALMEETGEPYERCRCDWLGPDWKPIAGRNWSRRNQSSRYNVNKSTKQDNSRLRAHRSVTDSRSLWFMRGNSRQQKRQQSVRTFPLGSGIPFFRKTR